MQVYFELSSLLFSNLLPVVWFCSSCVYQVFEIWQDKTTTFH